MRLALLLCGMAAALAVAPAASACPSLRNVKGFKGQVTVKMGASAEGANTDTGGIQTIQLGRVANKVHFHLGDKRHLSTIYDFKGSSTGGEILVDDVYEDTGLDQAGELKFDQPATKTSGEATLVLDRKSCVYKLIVGFQALAAYQGSPEADAGHLVGFGVSGPILPIPHDLKLSAADPTLYPQPQCDDVSWETHCAGIASGWMPDLIADFECASPIPNSTCLTDDNPRFDTPVDFSWNLKPIFK